MSNNQIEDYILSELNTGRTLNSLEIAKYLKVSHQEIVGTMKSLGDYLAVEMSTISELKLTREGQNLLSEGSPEFRLWQSLGEDTMPQIELNKLLGADVVCLGLNNGIKKNIVKVHKEADRVMISRCPEIKVTKDDTCELLKKINDGEIVEVREVEGFKRRKLVSLETTKVYTINKGSQYAPERKKLATELTRQMLQNDSWVTTEFKKLNFNAMGRETNCGQLHPLLKIRQAFREIFLELGFNEMETQQWAECSFWCFDTLFVPQKHPARDSQDTFFLSRPELTKITDQDYLKRVAATHEKGYNCAFSFAETSRNILRTHTTAVSSWVLYHLAQSAPLDLITGRRMFTPGKYFSIDRVFRNEEMDKTHLCEFHQVEGFIIDRNLSLSNMMHVLKQFFTRIGVTQLRFKPAYNPYTEPSMEIFGYHTGLKKWIEVGNSGVFRPEMIKPMGFDNDVTAIAWGLSLERPTMIKYGINNIHDLFGHKVDLSFIKRARIARY